jgi:hypothetical protein
MKGVPMPKKSSKTDQTVPHNCITFDDGRGHKWHVPFEETGSVPRVGEEVLLPKPPGADKRYSVGSIVYQFVQREVPEGVTGISVRGDRKSMYARLSYVTVNIR